mgnify:CR=1 FL=1
MAELTLQQVERIKNDLTRESISYAQLFYDLLDHICCDIEFEMDRGISFEEAYQHIKSWMGKNQCRKIQEETLLLTNKTFRFMKTIMKISGVISPVLLAVGAFGFCLMLLLFSFRNFPSSATATQTATASQSSTWSPRIRPRVAAAPARKPPLPVEVSRAKVPGPGSARKTRMAAQKAP